MTRDFMKAHRPLPNLPFSGDRFLLPTNLVLLVFSVFLPVSLRLHWHELWALGLIGLFLSPASFMLSSWELWRYQHQWRTIVAALISLLATVLGWATVVSTSQVSFSAMPANDSMKTNRRCDFALAAAEGFGRAVQAPSLLSAAVAYFFR